jgi:hypothetical protein
MNQNSSSATTVSPHSHQAPACLLAIAQPHTQSLAIALSRDDGGTAAEAYPAISCQCCELRCSRFHFLTISPSTGFQPVTLGPDGLMGSWITFPYVERCVATRRKHELDCCRTQKDQTLDAGGRVLEQEPPSHRPGKG